MKKVDTRVPVIFFPSPEKMKEGKTAAEEAAEVILRQEIDRKKEI